MHTQPACCDEYKAKDNPNLVTRILPRLVLVMCVLFRWLFTFVVTVHYRWVRWL